MSEGLDKGGKGDLGFESRTYEALERDFQEVLQELAGDRSLERFRAEYEKIHKALVKSHDGEKRLVKKCRELNAEIVANAAKVQTALRLNEEDQQTISALKGEIEKAWKMVDASHEKESKAKDTIQQLKLEIANLSRLVEHGAGLALGEESTLNELIKQKEDLVRERDQQIDLIVSLRSEMAEVQTKLRQSESEKLQLEMDIATMRDTIAEKKADAEREQRRKERMDKEIKDLRQAVEKAQQEIKIKQSQIGAGEEANTKLQQLIKEGENQAERLKKELNGLSEKVQKLHKDLTEQVHTNTQLMAENSQRQVELKAKEEEIAQIKAEGAKVNKLREQTLRKLKAMEDSKGEVEGDRDALKAEILSLEKEVDSLNKNLEAEKKKMDEVVRERDILNKLRTQAENTTSKQVDLIKVNENAKRNLEQEIQGYKMEAQRQSKIVYSLEKEREKYSIEASEAAGKYMSALEEVKMREMSILELQKRIGEGESKLKQQQNLYEAVRADRNLYSKNLIEAQDEIQEMKRKFKIMQHQIEQLKEEIGAKDLALVKEHFDHMKVGKEKDSLRMDLNKAKQEIAAADEALGSQKAEIEKLTHVINEADQERLRQKKEYDIVVNERDILGTQLIRRNDELALLYEKIKIQQSTLAKGQAQYRDRLNEIRVLKIKVNDLKRELHLLKSSVANIDVLKREVHQLGRELLAERTKVKALSEELENPLNVHRWRKLEGSDPGTYEMIQKIQTLQKRLIAKTEEAVEKDMLIQEKEKLYMELKNILARQPGPEVAEQLSIYQANLREKTKQMKAMASELNMYQAQVNEYKYEIERLVRELNDMKSKYFETKRREQIDREKTVKLPSPMNTSSGAKFVGGGFSLSQHP